jgi:hypothetical protein
MACPFHHLWADKNGTEQACSEPLPVDNVEADLKSPATAAKPGSPGSVKESHRDNINATVCPVARASPPQDAEPQPAAVAPSCPLGFGRGTAGPALTGLQCMICRSFFHNCVTTSCGHRFCSGCISRFADCPACGADVGELSEDSATQGRDGVRLPLATT